ncbi:unnamed protein product [Gemmata massiliana]|uniref:Uncharacterized protein n=1 Tax=Gemmata massiliana TaxID=1210884 RepID=A0A6P2D4B3_9BACT|nr:hypothetical protein [Gemmata massiliana]VTR96141.1 unnamed protein product [Gemmata massiliana]
MQSKIVFQSERAAGLESTIRANTHVALASVARVVEPKALSQQAMARARELVPRFATGSVSDSDLHHLSTILVSVGWNKNDDVFDPVESWVARHTPSHKQLNYEHDDSKIVGHITANYVMDVAGNAVADETCSDSLPAKFHIVSAGVLYKHWQTPELQTRMDTLIAEIAQGKWFVSMECRFGGFDYCLKDTSGGARVVARNEKTAFLSKHLRAYGGSGQYSEYRVGRVLRNIVFSGKGLVRNPANPESVILTAQEGTKASLSAAVATWFADRLVPAATTSRGAHGGWPALSRPFKSTSFATWRGFNPPRNQYDSWTTRHPSLSFIHTRMNPTLLMNRPAVDFFHPDCTLSDPVSMAVVPSTRTADVLYSNSLNVRFESVHIAMASARRVSCLPNSSCSGNLFPR